MKNNNKRVILHLLFYFIFLLFSTKNKMIGVRKTKSVKKRPVKRKCPFDVNTKRVKTAKKIPAIPKDVWLYIIEPLLSAVSITRLSGTNRYFHRLLKNNNKVVVWKNNIEQQSINWCLWKASRDGHRDLVDLCITKGANRWNRALGAASRGGHRDLVDLFIAKGANNLNWALEGASEGGHRDLVDFFIAKGANTWHWALDGASRGGHRDLVDLFITKGATDFNCALKAAIWGGHRDLVDLFITNGANDWNGALCEASWGGHQDLITFFKVKLNE
jgi:hypothetical protein